MIKVLTMDSSVGCGHSIPPAPSAGGGGAAAISSNAKLLVGGKPVLLASDAPNWAVAPGCSQTNADSGEKICTKVLSVTAGTSTKLSVGGVAVLTEDLGGTTDGAPDFSALSARNGASKLEVSQ